MQSCTVSWLCANGTGHTMLQQDIGSGEHTVVLMQVTVVLEHMFHPSEMEEEATLREDLEDDIKTECTKMGPVEKVRLPSCLLHPFPYCPPTQFTVNM